jgi:hypothetical protein
LQRQENLEKEFVELRGGVRGLKGLKGKIGKFESGLEN